MTAPQILVYGTVCLDQFILPGQTDAVEYPGGEAFNTATALAGWELPIALTGTAIGDDAEGLRLRELLQTHSLAQGIDTSRIPRQSGAVTPVCIVRVDEQGERFMSGRGFQQVTAPLTSSLSGMLEKRPIFTVDPNLGASAVEATLAAADAGCPIVSMDCAQIPDILAVSEIAVTSSEWIARIGWSADIEVAAKRIGGLGAKIAIVTQGVDGGVCFDSTTGTLRRYASIKPAMSIVDTTGAGDIFRAGLCFGLLLRPNDKRNDNDLLASILAFAAGAAALHCTKIGGGSRSSIREVIQVASLPDTLLF